MNEVYPLLYGDADYFEHLSRELASLAEHMRANPMPNNWAALSLDRGEPGDEKCHGVYEGKGPFKK
jgi:hypothetical protein